MSVKYFKVCGWKGKVLQKEMVSKESAVFTHFRVIPILIKEFDF